MGKIKLYALLYFSIIGLTSVGQNLSAIDFQKKMQELPNAPVIDVRTPGEFNQSHLKNAVNVNINDESFPNQISKLDKNKPIFVYCLSGSRSSYAASYMRSQGFKTIYDLTGGMIKWRSAGLPEISGKTIAETEMSQTQFNNLLNTDKLVLVDVYAEWCAPCKKMAPSLNEIQKEMETKVNVVRINADKNKSLVANLKVSALPTLLLYKNKKLIWTNTGLLTKQEIVSHLVK
ncbi:MAG TPA: thioredoxin [Bacteroidales bacterium]|nr:thioredoxin [Bacteroidales bacterium]